jgi:hypothetical protein
VEIFQDSNPVTAQVQGLQAFQRLQKGRNLNGHIFRKKALKAAKKCFHENMMEEVKQWLICRSDFSAMDDAGIKINLLPF